MNEHNRIIDERRTQESAFVDITEMQGIVDILDRH